MEKSRRLFFLISKRVYAMRFSSMIFPIHAIEIDGTNEQIVKGGRNLFPKLSEGFAGVQQIGVIGWGSQGPAQAQNLRDSLNGSEVRVVVGLREGSSSMEKARKAGFTEENGTLGEMFEVIRNSDMVIILISDAAQASLYKEIFANLKLGATLGFSHGFILGHMKNQGESWPQGHNVVMVAPKGMGPSVRRLYEQGKENEGAGINCSFAVEQECDARATDHALAWAVALGAPFTFGTTMESEYRSDIFGERGILLGGVWGLLEAVFRRRVLVYHDHPEEAFRRSALSLTGPINTIISRKGLMGLYGQFDDDEREVFELAYAGAYPEAMAVLREIYDEVSSGNEIRSVIMAGKRLKDRPMGGIEGTLIWKTGETVRSKKGEVEYSVVDPFTAGIYAGMMMAQVDLLCEKGHPWTEIANESVIEATDSLNPFMHARGVAYMVDNCSITARLGTRKWGPQFEGAMERGAFVAIDEGRVDMSYFTPFLNHPIHEALEVCGELRPSVDIAVQ